METKHPFWGGLLWCQWLVIFHFLCREPSHISSSSLHRFILSSFLKPLSDHLMFHCISCTPLLAIIHSLFSLFFFFCLQEEFATLCAKVWNLDTRGWKRTASSAGEVDRCVRMWVGMFVLFAACCGQPVVIRSVLIASGEFNDEQVGASHDAASSLSASFIPQTFAASLVMWPFTPSFVCSVLPTTAVVAHANTWRGCKALNYTWFN